MAGECQTLDPGICTYCKDSTIVHVDESYINVMPAKVNLDAHHIPTVSVDLTGSQNMGRIYGKVQIREIRGRRRNSFT